MFLALLTKKPKAPRVRWQVYIFGYYKPETTPGFLLTERSSAKLLSALRTQVDSEVSRTSPQCQSRADLTTPDWMEVYLYLRASSSKLPHGTSVLLSRWKVAIHQMQWLKRECPRYLAPAVYTGNQPINMILRNQCRFDLLK